MKKKIAVIITNMDVEYASEIQCGIIAAARALHYDVYFFNSYISAEETLKHNIGQYNIYTLANLERFDGVIVFSNLLQGRSVYDSVMSRLEGADIPVVGVDAPFGDYYWVGVENYHAMKAIVEHFIVHHKFTKINYIAGHSLNSDAQKRLQAYCDALKEHGIPVERERIYQGDFTPQRGREVAYEMLASKEGLPQAVVCANDDMAIGFCSVLTECGISVPEQVAVSGFDDTFEARNYVPKMTTVNRSLKNLGKTAVCKLKKHWEGQPGEQTELSSAVPVFAESCGCVSLKDDDVHSIRNRYLEMVDHYEKNLAESNIMIEELNDSKSFEDFINRLKHYVETLECERFYFCLDKNLVENLKLLEQPTTNRKGRSYRRTEGYAPIMSVPLAYEFGSFVEYDNFPSEWMLPWEEDGSAGNHAYIFLPIHFREICQGYVVVENSKFALGSQLFRTWLTNLSNGLENLRKQSDLKNMVEKLDRLYVTDPLTELYNRFGFARHTSRSFKECIAQQKQLMILFADLDGLKKINDRYGHDKGDVAIKAVADVLREACVQDEVCARFGGDEYVVYAADYDREKAEAFCRRCEERLDYYNQTLKQPFRIGASFGYEVFVPAAGDMMDKYIDKADQKMYLNKNEKYAKQKN